MDKSTLTPEESLLLISKTIEDTKNRFKDGSFMFLFWGILVFFVSISQFILGQLEINQIIYIENFTIRNWPVFLYIFGGIYFAVYIKRNYKPLPKTIHGNIAGVMGWFMGLNFMTLGFFFGDKLGGHLFTIFLVLFALWTIINGVLSRFKPLIICGFILNLIAFSVFFIDWQYKILTLTAGALVGIIIPGILLKIEEKKENV